MSNMEGTFTMARTELLALVALLAGACASSSIGSDVSRVRTLSKAQVLPHVDHDKVELISDKDVTGLLAKPLTEATAVRIALLNNRSLRADLRELGISRGRLMQAGLIANPTFEVELLPERESDYELRVEYDVSSLVLAPLAARAAGAELEAHRFVVAGNVVELGYQVRTAFYALAASEQRLAYAQRTLDALTAGRDAALAMQAAGNVPPLEASRQIVAYESARIEVAKIELAVADQREHVQRLLGLYGTDTEWNIAPGFAEIPAELHVPEQLETKALAASLDLKAIEQRLDAAGRRTGFARASALIPHVDVDFHALHADGDARSQNQDRFRYGGGVSVGVPLFGRQQGNQRIAEAEFDVLLERQQELAIELRSHAREARNHVLSAHARVRAYETTLVPAQRSLMEQTLLMYNAMQLGVFELLSARRAQLEIELAYVDAQAAYWQATAQLDALLAGKIVDDDHEPARGAMSGSSSDSGQGH
jgi:cobalt-zinc-cadmium efflux system outer membrane protein